jgi:hypothetical protein
MHPFITAELVRQRRAELQAHPAHRREAKPIRRSPAASRRVRRLRLLLFSR